MSEIVSERIGCAGPRREGRESSNELLCLQLSPTRDNKQAVFLASDKYVPE